MSEWNEGLAMMTAMTTSSKDHQESSLHSNHVEKEVDKRS
jgi:hypothetical protein